MTTQHSVAPARGVALFHIQDDGSINIQSYDRLNDHKPLGLKDFQLVHAAVCEYLHTLEEKEGTTDGEPQFIGEIMDEYLKGLEEKMRMELDEEEWSVRSLECLKGEGLKTFGDLIKKTEKDLLRIPNFGRRSLRETKEILEKLGFRLNDA